MPNNDSPSPGASRQARGFVMGLVAVAAAAVLCCGGIGVYGLSKSPGIMAEAAEMYGEASRWNSLFLARYGLPCSIDERTATIYGRGTRKTLSVRFTNVPDERIPGGSREAFALDAARFARSIVRPGVVFTDVCIVFVTEVNVSPGRMTRAQPHCFAWAALETPDASGLDASVR